MGQAKGRVTVANTVDWVLWLWHSIPRDSRILETVAEPDQLKRLGLGS